MSKIEDLIKQYCPDGVEWKRLGDVCDITSGSFVKKDKQSTDGRYLVYNGGITHTGYYDEYNTEADKVIISARGAGAGFVNHVMTRFWAGNSCFVLNIIHNTMLRSRFLYYVMTVQMSLIIAKRQEGSIPAVSKNQLMLLQIPVPHIAVQDEIVRILDKFTELEKELEKELELRRKQYAWYRDELLTFGDEVERKKLGEIMTIQRGASPRPISKYITEDSNGVNWIKIGDTSTDSKYVVSCAEKITQEGAKKSRFLKAGSFILSNSMSFGRPYILKIDGCIHDGWISMTDFENVITPDFLYHVLMSSVIQYEMRQKASNGGAVSNLNSDIVKSIEIPIPSPTEQERIVKILDKFDTLTTSLTSGLPAEIKLRKQQYEYYRDYLFGLLN